jgi:hypothetical protein
MKFNTFVERSTVKGHTLTQEKMHVKRDIAVFFMPVQKSEESNRDEL